ncbi:MAG TPA: PDZ domain-containing protein [Deltaproteobacteria bacterium]|nr:PDZ domain-containing protein [Deltaproteobacteria bacterium]
MKLLFTVLNLFFLIAAVYLGHSAYQKIRPDQGIDKPVIQEPAKKAVSSKSKPSSSSENYRAVVDRNLFHTKEKPEENSKPPEPAQSEPLKPTRLLVKLWGTVTSGEDSSYAIIEDKNKKDQNLYRIGDTIQNATVKEILREKVVLNVQGKDEVLEIEKLEAGGGGGVSRPQPQKQEVAGPPSVRRIRLKRSQLENALKSEEDISKQAEVKLHFTDGRQDGIILTGILPNSVYRRLGLRNGDILLGIDEADIQSAEDVSSVRQRLSSSSELTLKIKRRGRLTTMNYTIE